MKKTYIHSWKTYIHSKNYLHDGSCDLSWTNTTELPAQIICAIRAKHSLINPPNHSKAIKRTNQIHQVANFSSLQTTKSLPMLLESSNRIKTHDSVTTQLILLAPSFPLHPHSNNQRLIWESRYIHTYICMKNQIKFLKVICCHSFKNQIQWKFF